MLKTTKKYNHTYLYLIEPYSNHFSYSTPHNGVLTTRLSKKFVVVTLKTNFLLVLVYMLAEAVKK